MTQVLVNRHHADLHWSIHLLSQRLGWDLYTQKGMEWFDNGYFQMHQHPDKENPGRYLAKWALDYEVWDDKSKHERRGCSDYPKLKTMTLDSDVKLDIIICTNRENEEPMRKYRDERQPQAKLVRQVGNRLDVVGYDNCIYSDLESYNNNDTPHKILYHQEFDLNLFPYEPPTNRNNIFAFQHYLERYEPAEILWIEHQRKYPDFYFQHFGKGNDGGFIYKKRDYVKKMLEASFVWMVKDWDGYSHVIHNAFALGRPMIVRRDDIKGKIFEPLFDETTCIYMDEMDRILEVDLQQMSLNCYNRFKEVVDFNKEAIELKEFFENLI